MRLDATHAARLTRRLATYEKLQWSEPVLGRWLSTAALPILWVVDTRGLPLTGTCDVSTIGRRSGTVRRIEIWYVIIAGQLVLTGTPGARSWLANLRSHPEAVLHLRDPIRDVQVVAREVTDPAQRRQVAEEAARLQPWYAGQPYSVDDWIAGSPMVILETDPQH